MRATGRLPEFIGKCGNFSMSEGWNAVFIGNRVLRSLAVPLVIFVMRCSVVTSGHIGYPA